MKEGDMLPEMVLKNVINDRKEVLDLEEFKGKALLLDFWGHGCSGCIKAFPKLDSLQMAYKDNLQIIMINNESLDSSIKWLARRKDLAIPKLPMVTGGGILSKLFPQNFYPWHVWIDKDRVVRHITQGHNATIDNMAKFLKGEELQVEKLIYQAKKSETFRQAVENYEDVVQRSLAFSALYLYRDAEEIIPSNETFVKYGDKWRYRRRNATKLALLKDAFLTPNEKELFPKNAILLEVDDATDYDIPKKVEDRDTWTAKNLYAYDFIAPAKNREVFTTLLQNDLQEKLSIEVRREQRKIKCLVLKHFGNKGKLKTKGGQSTDSLFAYRPVSSRRIAKPHMRNMPFEILVKRLQANVNSVYSNQVQLIDQTGYKGNIDIILESYKHYPLKLEEIKRELKAYGLFIEEAEVEMDCLIVSRGN
jgi:uncharacterized protein (TIGR03435 family)